MSTRNAAKSVTGLGLAVALLLISALAVHADNVVNNISANPGSDTFVAGGSTEVGYKIAPGVGNTGDTQKGCNADDGTPATVTIVVPPGSDIQATPNSLIFNSCNDFLNVSLSSHTEGDYVISVIVNDNGGGGYNTDPATFTLHVTAPTSSDNTPPDIIPNVVGQIGKNGWYIGDVQVTWTVEDDQSAISSSTGCDATTISEDTTGTTLTCSATSAGGENTKSVTIKRDATAPNVTATPDRAPNAAGWYNAPVVVTFAGTDATSDNVTCDAPKTYSTPDSAAASVVGSCTDAAGNSASATFNLKYDATAPTLAPTFSLNPVILNGTVTASPNADDNLSGVASQSCDTVNTSIVGKHSVLCTATDYAGNTASKSVEYNVSYRFDGFLQPINDTAHTQICGLPCPLSIFKGGSTIPVKFQLKDANGNIVQPATLPLWVTPQQGTSTTSSVDESTYNVTTTTGNSYRWDSTSQQYIYNWSTKGVNTGFYWRIGVQLDDNNTYYVNIGLR